MAVAQRFLDATQLSEKTLLPGENISERVSVPMFDAVHEFLHSLGDIEGVVIPRILDDGWEGKVVEPNGFKPKGLFTKGMG